MPALVFLATSAVMAEGVYLLAQVGAVIAVERITRRDAPDARAPIVAAILSVVAMLIRSTAAALIVAAVVYLVIARRWKQAAIYAAVVIVAMTPWQIYASAHAATVEERASHGGPMAYSYAQLLRASRFTFGNPDDTATSSVLIGRAVENFTIVLTRDVGALFVPALYRGPNESGQEVFSIGRPGLGSMGSATGTQVLSGGIAAIILIGWLSSSRERLALPGLVLAATVPMVGPVVGQTFRYFVPLSPYLVMFFWRGLRSQVVARIALLVVIGLHVMDHSAYIHQKLTGTPDWIADWNEDNELLAWVAANVPAGQGIAATNPGLIYLATGHRTVAIDGMRSKREQWRAAGIRYVASTVQFNEVPPVSWGWRLRFRSDRSGLWVVEMTSN
jgi:hypothetical protein